MRAARFVVRTGACPFVFPTLHLAGVCADEKDSLPIPSREEIQNSTVPPNGGYAVPAQRAASPVQEDPSAELEKELASTHLGTRRA